MEHNTISVYLTERTITIRSNAQESLNVRHLADSSSDRAALDCHLPECELKLQGP